jgi:hypothetical protein
MFTYAANQADRAEMTATLTLSAETSGGLAALGAEAVGPPEWMLAAVEEDFPAGPDVEADGAVLDG